MRARLLIAATATVLLVACGSGDGSGGGSVITATLPPDASIDRPTDPPATDASAPPEETQAPEETSPPEETQPAETAAPDTAPSSSVASDDEADDGTVWWPWVLLAIAVIGAIAVIVARSRRSRSGPGASWSIRAATLLDETEQLTSHLAAVTPGGLHAVAPSDAVRLATMRVTLVELIGSAPDARSQAALNSLTTPMAALHGAVDAVAMSAGPSVEPPASSVAQLAAQLHTAAASARAGLAMNR